MNTLGKSLAAQDRQCSGTMPSLDHAQAQRTQCSPSQLRGPQGLPCSMDRRGAAPSSRLFRHVVIPAASLGTKKKSDARSHAAIPVFFAPSNSQTIDSAPAVAKGSSEPCSLPSRAAVLLQGRYRHPAARLPPVLDTPLATKTQLSTLSPPTCRSLRGSGKHPTTSGIPIHGPTTSHCRSRLQLQYSPRRCNTARVICVCFTLSPLGARLPCFVDPPPLAPRV